MLIILDKDGTLVEPASGNTFVQHPEDQRLLPGVADRVAELHHQGHTLVIASNQGGVGKYKTLEDAIAEMRYCMKLLPSIEMVFFCPDFEGSKLYGVVSNGLGITYDYASEVTGFYKRFAPFRKPEPGMLKAAMAWGCCADAIMVGDRAEDSQAAQSAGIRFIDAAEWRANGIQSLSSSSSVG